MPTLTVREGGKEYLHQIDSDEVSIGRAESNTIAIHDAAASKEHCRLQRVGERWKIVDLESKNGTRLNGQLRNKAWLAPGDTIGIGKAEIRFGSGGAAGASGARRARGTAPPSSPPSRRGMEGDEQDERPAGPRRYRRSQSDKMVTVGLVLLASLVSIFVFIWVSKQFDKDEHNTKVLSYADQLTLNDRWQDALDYLQQNGDPSGTRYQAVVDKIKQLQEGKDDFRKDRARQEALRLMSRTETRIRAYNSGNRSITAAEILERVNRLKTDYAGVDLVRDMRKRYPAWFAGKAPQRAVDLLSEGGLLENEWEQAVAHAREFEKGWHFREARETIERFVTTREANLSSEEIEIYRERLEAQLKRINGLAESIYFGRKQVADGYLRNKRYDRAIAEYRKIIEKFGLDKYLRMAQAEITGIEEAKANE